MSERSRAPHLPSVLYLRPTGEQLVEFCGSSLCAISHAHFFKIILSLGVRTGIPPRWSAGRSDISGLVTWFKHQKNQDPDRRNVTKVKIREVY